VVVGRKSLMHWFLCRQIRPIPGTVQARVTLGGGWGRARKGDAPRSGTGALGARRLQPTRPQAPSFCHQEGGADLEPCPVFISRRDLAVRAETVARTFPNFPILYNALIFKLHSSTYAV
jgi:hypothetical protein